MATLTGLVLVLRKRLGMLNLIIVWAGLLTNHFFIVALMYPLLELLPSKHNQDHHNVFSNVVTQIETPRFVHL